jgi:hypothetical protein
VNVRFTPKADIIHDRDVRFVPKADIVAYLISLSAVARAEAHGLLRHDFQVEAV